MRKETEKEEFETKAEVLRRRDEERTAKNRAKRNKKKSKGGGGDAATTGSGSSTLQDGAQSGSMPGQSTASHDRINGRHVNGSGGQQSNSTKDVSLAETPKGVVIFDDDD